MYLISDIVEFGRKVGSKDKVKRKSGVARAVGYSLLTSNPISGVYLANKDLKSTGKKRTVGGFARTGAEASALGQGIVGGITGARTGGVRGAAIGLGSGVVGGAIGGSISGALAYGVRRTFAKDKKKFKSGR